MSRSDFTYTVVCLFCLVSGSLSYSPLLGAGYSKDEQKATTQRCFVATIVSTTKQVSPVKLSEAATFLEMKRALSVNSSYNYDGNDHQQKMRGYNETDLTLPLFFYVSYSQEVKEKIEGYGLEALTNFGKGSYKHHKYFGVLCGDYYISAYTEGAYVIFSATIRFTSQKEKEEFKSTYGPNYGSLLDTYQKVHSIVAKYNSEASIGFNMEQFGANVFELLKLLGLEDYSCKITSSEKCINTAYKILNYANDDFPKQLNSTEELNALHIIAAEPIETIGLTPPLPIKDRF